MKNANRLLACGTYILALLVGIVATPSAQAQTFTTLHSFDNTDGANPDAALVQAPDGNLYGTTAQGGVNASGTAFKITPSGKLTTLHSFCTQSGCTDGAYAFAGLVQATNGDFYGETFQGAANSSGTVFKITPSGTLTTLYDFCSQSGCTDGADPFAGLVQATDGNFYWATAAGGSSTACLGGCGTVFKITPGGTLTTLHNFNGTDGGGEAGGLVQGTDGPFYGETTIGGTTSRDCPGGCGTIFSLAVGLAPFVETQPTSGNVGAAVKILGNKLAGATSVTFNGTAATFTVVSASLITTTVPPGATTGTVQVVTPSGTLSSNVPFRVLP